MKNNTIYILILALTSINLVLSFLRFNNPSNSEDYEKTLKTLKASKHIIEEKDKLIVTLLQEKTGRDSLINANNTLILSLAGELNKRNVRSIKIANDTVVSEVETMDILSNLKRYED